MNRHQRIVIFNRAPATSQDGWIHVVPKGELPNVDAGIVQILDDTALDAILAKIEKDKNRLGDNWPGVYGGREHFIYDEGKDSAALAWFKDFEKRPDGIWAKADGLTPEGEQAVKNRQYKFTSFVSDPTDLKKVANKSKTGPAKYRVVGIETVGFTNYANAGSGLHGTRELLAPITNRSSGKIQNKMKKLPDDKKCPDCDVTLKKSGKNYECPECSETFSGSAETDETENTKTKNRTSMNKIATTLGLAAEASEDSIVAALTKIQNRLTELEPLGEENKKLKNRLTELDGAAVDALLSAHNVKDEKVRNRLKPVISDIAVADRAAALVDFGYTPGETKPVTRVLNRGSKVAETESGAGNDEQALTQKIQNRCSELQGKGVKFDAAWNQARREIVK